MEIIFDQTVMDTIVTTAFILGVAYFFGKAVQ